MQVYRGMDIGTAKPDPGTRRRVPHHLVDIADPADEVTAAEFQRRGRSVLDALAAGERAAIVAGGSGLHYRALVDPLTFAPSDPGLRAELEQVPAGVLAGELVAADPGAAHHVDMANPRRVVRAVEVLRLTGLTPTARAATPEAQALAAYRAQVPHIAVGVDPGERLAVRVERRLDAMLAAGLLDEVAGLDGRLGRTAAQAVGYKELLPVVRGEREVEAGREAAIRATLGLAKRQRTFFGRDPRITWIPWDDDPSVRAHRAATAVEEAPWNS